jgi:hypothetical protein
LAHSSCAVRVEISSERNELVLQDD